MQPVRGRRHELRRPGKAPSRTSLRPLTCLLLTVALALTLVVTPAAAPRPAHAGDPAGSPVGNLESVMAAPGGIALKGWALDPDSTASIYVWVTVDGVGRHLYANRPRPDVAAAYPSHGPAHGFSGTLPTPAGRHTVCVTASNVGAGVHKGLGCRTVTVHAGSPIGNLERVAAVPGGIELKGWTLDPETTASLYVWVTLDGVGRHLYANQPRPDVGAAYPGYGGAHGFRATLSAPPGRHTVCATASNVAAGSHSGLGCRTVTVYAGSPFGNLEAARGREGQVELKGWAIDPDTTGPVYVWVTVDGVGRHHLAGAARHDVGAVYPGYGPHHGFAVTFTVPAGTHTICVTVSNVGAGGHTGLGCRSVTSGFAATTTAITPTLAARMSTSWRPGCPVPLADLRYVTMTYRGFDGYDHRGEMVLSASVVTDVVGAFRRIYDSGFPIFSMRLVDDFGGSDAASMAADNTSAFNCRAVTGGTSFSRHSYGDAIDINPRENPYVLGGLVLPPSGAAYLGRPALPGVIREGDAVVQAFDAIGWSWGGRWRSPIDYQHFSRTGG